MNRIGHLGFNAALSAPFVPLVSNYWSLELALAGVVLAVGLANLPDVDQPLPGIDHRGPTHTVWFAGLVGLFAGVAVAAISGSAAAFAVGFVAGTGSVLAHLAGDVATPMGISPLAPLSGRHVTLNWFKSRNRRVNRAVLLVGTVALVTSLSLTIGGPMAIVPPA